MSARVSQSKIEVLRDSSTANMLTTQAVVEVARQGDPRLLVTQVVVEVIYRSFASNIASGGGQGVLPANYAYVT